MSTEPTKTRRVERRTVILPIERIMETGWLDLAELRRFVDEAERLTPESNVRIWWTRGPEDEPPRLEAIAELKMADSISPEATP